MSIIHKISKLTRRAVLATTTSLVALAAITGAHSLAEAGAYPEKPVTLIIPYRAGGSTETTARILSVALGKELGQKILVVTKPGAGGSVGATHVSKAKADGYTLLFAAVTALTWAPMSKKGIEYTADSFTIVAAVTEYQQALVVKSGGKFKTYKDLIEYSKKNPGLNVADQGGLSKEFVNFVAKKEGVDWTAIPTKGGGEMIPFLLGGKIEVAYSGGVHNKYGDKITVLASFNADRLSSAPDAPSIKEMFDLAMPAAAVIAVPKGTPADVVKKLEGAIEKAMQHDDVKGILGKLKFPNKFVGTDGVKKNTDADIKSLKTILSAM